MPKSRRRPVGRQAVVAGATGLVGGHLVTSLLQDASWSAVHSLVRRASGRGAPRLSEHVVDFATLRSSDLPAADVIFCCLGTTLRTAGSVEAFRRVDLDYVVQLARAGREREVPRFVLVSSMGADARSAVPYSRTKGEVEAAVAALGYPSLEIARPSFLTGQRPRDRAGERLAIGLLTAAGWLLAGPLRSYRPIAAETVARALAAIAAEDDARGVRIHPSDALERLGGVSSR